MIRIAISDFLDRIISNKDSNFILCFAILKGLLYEDQSVIWKNLILCMGLFALFYVLWHTGKIGAGDGKLIFYLSLYYGFFVVCEGVFLAAVLAILTYRKNGARQNLIPFGTYIAIGMMIRNVFGIFC